jgi:hypothetical protein
LARQYGVSCNQPVAGSGPAAYELTVYGNQKVSVTAADLVTINAADACALLARSNETLAAQAPDPADATGYADLLRKTITTVKDQTGQAC